MKASLAFSAIVCLSLTHGWAQTLGVLHYDDNASEGYTLLSPVAANTTYLIDACGRLINRWDSDRPPAQSAYLMPDGRLWRSGKVAGAFFSGGVGGSVQIFDWEGNLVWDYRYASDDYQQHHDIEPLPNGNVLLIAWELMLEDSALANGRDPFWITERGIWPDKVVEIRPTEFDQGETVWEWRSRDHLIQDFDTSKLNHGIVKDHPELIDFNFVRNTDPPLAIPDWIHTNSIDYNAELDQILLSSRKFNEIWVIDHSTTTAEAASHLGGRSGKGGDLLYRWGNPIAYQRGTKEDQEFFGQHDAHWIPNDLPMAGSIMTYNNGFERPNNEFSSIDIIEPPLLQNGTYTISNPDAFGPIDIKWTLRGDGSIPFGSGRMSGVQIMPNQSLFICNADQGRLIEISVNGTLLWEYISPILGRSPGEQGSTPSQNNLFHAPHYSPNYEAFENRVLVPGDPIELNPIRSPCEITSIETYTDLAFRLINPASELLTLINESHEVLNLVIYDLEGRLWLTAKCRQGSNEISIKNTPIGIYVARVSHPHLSWDTALKFVKAY